MKIPQPEKLPPFEPVPHSTYCRLCPSPIDPETEDYMPLPDGERQKHVFPCALRPNRLCRQICELMDFESSKHSHLLKGRT